MSRKLHSFVHCTRILNLNARLFVHSHCSACLGATFWGYFKSSVHLAALTAQHGVYEAECAPKVLRVSGVRVSTLCFCYFFLQVKKCN